MLTLEWPLWLVLLPLPWLARRLLPASARQLAAIAVPSALLRAAATPARADDAGTGRSGWLAWLAWALLLLACALPRWQGDPISLPNSGRDLMLAVDISGSMDTRDMVYDGQQANRLQVVKAVVSQFIERRQGDRLGLILFGTQAYLQAPLTFDRATVNQLLQEAQLGFAGEKTAIGDAIGLAIKRLRDRPASSRVLILLTDGANTAGEVSPQQAASLAAQGDLKIYTIGLGADQLQLPGLLGSQFGARTVNPSVDLDEASLRDIAGRTGGDYFRARNPDELMRIYALLDQLEPAAQDDEEFRPVVNLSHWPLALALVLMLLPLLHTAVLSRWSRTP